MCDVSHFSSQNNFVLLLKYKVTLKINKIFGRPMVKEKIIKPGQCDDWAAPIVPLLRSDQKRVQICNNFKLSINCDAKLDRYPISKIEDLFARLEGDQFFTELDMSQAYQ